MTTLNSMSRPGPMKNNDLDGDTASEVTHDDLQRAVVAAGVSLSPTPQRIALLSALARIALLGTVDVFMIMSVWNQVLGMTAFASATVATVVALGSGLLMWGAGEASAAHQETRARGELISCVLLVLTWILIGLGISLLRWTAGDLFAPAPSLVEGAAAAGAADHAREVGKHHLLAVVLIPIYVLPGILAAYEARRLRSPQQVRLNAAVAAYAKAVKQEERAEARAKESALFVQLKGQQLDEDIAAADAQEAIDSWYRTEAARIATALPTTSSSPADYRPTDTYSPVA